MSALELAQALLVRFRWENAEKIVDVTGDEICAFPSDRPQTPFAIGIGDEALVFLTSEQAEQLIAQIRAILR